MRNYKIVDFAVLEDHKIKLKVHRPCLGIKKKTMEHKGDNNNNCDWCFWYSNQSFIIGTGGFEGWKTSGDHPNYSITENGKNTEKCPVNLRRLAVTQIPVKNHQLKLM